MRTFKCYQCGEVKDELEEFPGGICLDCYEVATMALTPAELHRNITAAFHGGGILRK